MDSVERTSTSTGYSSSRAPSQGRRPSVALSRCGTDFCHEKRDDPRLIHVDPAPHWFAEPQPDTFGSQIVLTRNNRFRVAWTFILCGLLVYVGTVYLYRFSFCTFHVTSKGIEPIGVDDIGWIVIDNIVDVLFWFDLAFNFFLSYQNSKDMEVVSIRLIARRYLTGFFWINLLACIPDALIGRIIGLIGNIGDNRADLGVARVSRLQRMSRLARLSRLSRLVKFFSMENHSDIMQRLTALKAVRLTNFAICLTWIVHLMACGWYLTAAMHKDVNNTWLAKRLVNRHGDTLIDQPPGEQWLVSMYFVLTVFTTVGFGDISAGTEAEIIYVTLTMAVGAVVNGLIIGAVINTVTSTDKVQECIDEQMQLIDAFCEHAEMDKCTSKRIKKEVAWRSRMLAVERGFNQSEMKELITGKCLPRWLVSQIPETLFDGKLVKSMFTQCCAKVMDHVPPRLSCILAVYLQRADFKSGEIIYQMNDLPFTIYLVMDGTFSYLARPTPKGGRDVVFVDSAQRHVESEGRMHFGLGRGSSTGNHVDNATGSQTVQKVDPTAGEDLWPYRLFSFNSYFGDIEVLYGCQRVTTCRCERSGVVLCLRKDDFTQVADEFPMFFNAWQVAASQRKSMRATALSKLTSPGFNYQLLAGRQILHALKHKQQIKKSAVTAADEVQAAQVKLARQRSAPKLNSENGSVMECLRKLSASQDTLRAEVHVLRQALQARVSDSKDSD